MVCTSFIVYKYGGWHCIYPNPHGRNLVEQCTALDGISPDSEEHDIAENYRLPPRHSPAYDEWLVTRRERCVDVEDLWEAEIVQSDGFWKFIFPEVITFDEPSLQLSFREHLETDSMSDLPTIWLPRGTVDFEWVYTFDLDREIFSVNNTIHFPLRNIPKDWINLTESFHARFPGFPILVPRQPQQQVVEKHSFSPYSNLETSIVRPKGLEAFAPGKGAAVAFARHLFRCWTAEMNKQLDSYSPDWVSDNVIFRELASAFLCFASGFFEGLNVEGVRDLATSSRRAIMGEFAAEYTDSSLNFIADFCSESDLPGRNQWLAPPEKTFWIAGVLVRFCPQLDDINIAKSNIAGMVGHGRKSGNQSFHAILMSLEHVILIKAMPVGQVQHTQILKLRKYKNLAEGRERGQDETQSNQTSKRNKKFDFISRIKQKVAARHTSAITGSRGNGFLRLLRFDSIADQTDRPPARDASPPPIPSVELPTLRVEEETDGFVALAHMFDVVKLEQLSMHYSQGRFPSEIYWNIVDQTDPFTRHQCSHVSRAFRAYCQQKFYFDSNLAQWHRGRKAKSLIFQGGDTPSKYNLLDFDNGVREAIDCNNLHDFYGERFWVPILQLEGGKKAAALEGAFLLEKRS